MYFRRCLLIAGLILSGALLPLTAVQARAQGPGSATAQRSDRATAVPFADSASRDRIVEAIERKYNAKVVRVTEVTVEGHLCYDLRLLSSERSWVVRVDAESGREMPRED